MADYSGRPVARVSTALAVVVALAAPSLPPAATASSEEVPTAVERWAAEGDARFFHAAQRTTPRELLDALQLRLPDDRVIVNLAWGDMTGDRRDDVLALELDFGPGGLALTEMSTRFEALDGRTGRSLWRREFDRFTLPVPVRLGRKARTGVLAPSRDNEDDTTTFLAIDHRGRTFYEQSFQAASRADAGVVTGREDVISFDVQNSLRGGATEVLIAIADVRQTGEVDPALPALVGRTRTATIDGRTGRVVTHPDVEVGVGRVPTPLVAPDLDGDGLDDHVITYVLPDAERDEETGLPIVPDPRAEYVRGRRGTDGAKLWTSDPLDFGDDWDGPALQAEVGLGDQTRDGHDEIVLSYDRFPSFRPDMQFGFPSPHLQGVWSLSGKDGDLLWHRSMTSVVVVEDIDRDKRRDVVLVEDVSGKKRSGSRVVGASGLDARPVYGRFFPVPRDEDQQVESYVWEAGDLQPDGVRDVVLWQVLERHLDNGGGEWEIRDPMLLSGATGARFAGSRHVSPLRASLDGRGDDLYRWDTSSLAGIDVVDGRTRALRLSIDFDIPLTLPADDDYLIPMVARLDGDRCADFVGTLANSRSTFAVAIDGGTGRLLWAKRQRGLELGGPIQQTRRVDRNRAC